MKNLTFWQIFFIVFLALLIFYGLFKVFKPLFEKLFLKIEVRTTRKQLYKYNGIPLGTKIELNQTIFIKPHTKFYKEVELCDDKISIYELTHKSINENKKLDPYFFGKIIDFRFITTSLKSIPIVGFKIQYGIKEEDVLWLSPKELIYFDPQELDVENQKKYQDWLEYSVNIKADGDKVVNDQIKAIDDKINENDRYSFSNQEQISCILLDEILNAYDDCEVVE